MKVTFTTPQIVEATGLPKRTVQHWTKQGVLIPTSKATGSGSTNGFEWREVEIAKLLSMLVRRKIQADQLAELSKLFREIMTMGEVGFVAENPDLLKTALRLIDVGGPKLEGMGGGGKGLPQPTKAQRAESERMTKSTEMTIAQMSKYWSFIAYGMAVRKRTNVAWEIWWDEKDNVSITARFPLSKLQEWSRFAIWDHDDQGFGIVLPLTVLCAD